MELIIRVRRCWREEGYRHLSISFLKMDDKDGRDSITFGNNAAEIERLVKLARATEDFIDNYPLDESDDKPIKDKSSS